MQIEFGSETEKLFYCPKTAVHSQRNQGNPWERQKRHWIEGDHIRSQCGKWAVEWHTSGFFHGGFKKSTDLYKTRIIFFVETSR